jgi:hypothetical protein
MSELAGAGMGAGLGDGMAIDSGTSEPVAAPAGAQGSAAVSADFGTDLSADFGADIGADLGGADLGDADMASLASQADSAAASLGPGLRASNGQFVRPPEPPQSWPAEVRERIWAQLDPQARQYFATSEAERHRTFTDYGNRVKSYEPFERLIDEYKNDFALRGIEPGQAFAYLLNAQRQLDANPVDALVNLGLGYGIDLRPLLSGQADAQLQQVRHYADALGQRAAEVERQLKASQAEAAQARHALEGLRRAEDARKAARINVRSSSGAPNPKTMEDTITELARRAYG